MIWVLLVVLIISLSSYIFISQCEIADLQKRVHELGNQNFDQAAHIADLRDRVADLEDEVIGLLKPKGQL